MVWSVTEVSYTDLVGRPDSASRPTYADRRGVDVVGKPTMIPPTVPMIDGDVACSGKFMYLVWGGLIHIGYSLFWCVYWMLKCLV